MLKKDSNVIISRDLQTTLPEVLKGIDFDRLFILTDDNTRRHCLPLVETIPAIKGGQQISILPSDENKDIRQVETVWRFLSEHGATRHSLLINLGGGMVTDLGGFAGATFKRGIHTLNIPTTLMGAVDAAAGGKTGVNFYGLKNEIGAFHAPERVIVCPLFFRSLDSRNFYSGYAEMLKHALLSNAALYVRTLAFDRVSEGDGGNDFDSLLADSVAVKEEIVAADPHEHDIRKALNLGHTVGHAIESLSFKRGQALLHGEAVAVGLVCELYLSHIRLGFPLTELRRLTGFVREHYPLFVYGCNEYETLYGFMTHDKKNVSDKINFSLLAGIGDIRIDSSASREEIYEALDFYRETL